MTVRVFLNRLASHAARMRQPDADYEVYIVAWRLVGKIRWVDVVHTADDEGTPIEFMRFSRSCFDTESPDAPWTYIMQASTWLGVIARLRLLGIEPVVNAYP